jgi:leucyl aminopeptidase
MNLQVVSGEIARFEADVIVVNLFEGVQQPGGATGSVDQALEGLISKELGRSDGFKGKLGDTWVLHTHYKLPARHVVLVGLGKQEKLGPAQLRRASAAGVRACIRLKAKTAASILHGAGIGGFDTEAAARLFAEGALLGAYKFTKLKGKSAKAPDNGDAAKEDAAEPTKLETLSLVEVDKKRLKNIEAGVKTGTIIAEQVNLARDWVFDSPNNVTPSFLVDRAREIEGVSCTILDIEALKQLGAGAFTMVAQGSDAPAFLIHLSYQPKGKAKKKVALVGKGITFDSGGLSLKPSGSMELMKMDMAGAAAVLATMGGITRLKGLDIQVDAFIPTCENMPSGHASRPGDVVRALNGKTIEVNNTDAEGRLILADALTYSQREAAPDEIIDLATLTGACIVALGKTATGIMGTGQQLIDDLRAAGEKAGEKLWQLPLYEEYEDNLKSDVADLINSGAKGEAGSSIGGMFLKEFIEADRPWAHLDIAGPAYTSKDQPEVPKGATGVGVRTLLYYLYNL